MSTQEMTSPVNAVAAVNRRYFLDYPAEVARRLEQLGPDDAAPSLSGLDVPTLVPVWNRLMPQTAAELLDKLEDETALKLIEDMQPNRALQLLGVLDKQDQEELLEKLPPPISKELRRLMAYPEHSAGRLMDTRIAPLRADTTAGTAIETLRRSPAKTAHSLFLIDEDHRLIGRVAIQDLAIADPASPLESFMRPVAATVDAFTDEDEIAEILDNYKLYDLAVVDVEGRLIGMVYHATLVDTLQETTGADLQTMVGASRDERALSPARFAVRNRLPWLLINLVTAFMAAAVVGLFEETIAAFTALAVLLPVVAGQSGNAGSQ
ncbi:MAG: CBS domain-containing protein, partial [Alphaproteobacteria bacterium]|nr:CBS domain-containing protein [Alphaproteobacteria bacterium]